MLTLNEQETARGDAERIRLLVNHLALSRRGTAQINLDRHDRPPLRTRPDTHHAPRYPRPRPLPAVTPPARLRPHETATPRTLFAKELPPTASSYFATVVERHGLLPGLARVLRLIPPGEISEPDLVRLFHSAFATTAALALALAAAAVTVVCIPAPARSRRAASAPLSNAGEPVNAEAPPQHRANAGPA